MEEMLEVIVAATAIVIGIIAKASSSKKKKTKSDTQVGNLNWEELQKKFEQKLNSAFGDEDDIEEEDKEPLDIHPVPEVKTAPAVEVAKAAPHEVLIAKAAAEPAKAPAPVMFSAFADADSGSMVDPLHPEGCHAEEGGIKAHAAPVEKQAKPEKAMAVVRISKPATARKGRFGSMSSAGLKQAVIMSEVLGKPVALRGANRR